MKRKLLGDWKIVEMEQWDQAFVDLVVPGYIRIEKSGSGEFQFGAIHGILFRIEEETGANPRIGFTWEGSDECNPACGNGWVKRKGDGIKGRIRIRDGDSLRFNAERMAS